MQIIENLLEEDVFNGLAEQIKTIPWFYTQGVASSASDDGYYFTHMFYRNAICCSDFLPLVQPILEKLKPKALIRAKGNLYVSTPYLQKHEFHVDEEFSHCGAVFYINTNDGFTEFENGVRVDSVANRLVLFDPSVWHCSTNCTDKSQPRLTINFNYF